MKDKVFARRVSRLSDTTVRETLRFIADQNIISFAGGAPNPLLFPTQEIGKIIKKLLRYGGEETLQYGQTEGLPELREQIAHFMSLKHKIFVSPEEILITTGSQQALDILGRAYIEKGNVVVVENPTYFAALSAFSAYEPSYISVDIDDEGIDVDKLDNVLKNNYKRNSCIYTIPTFQNPTGACWSKCKREQVVRLLKKHEVILIEDDPYSDIYFTKKPPQSLFSLAKKKSIIYVGTFSKTLCPGLRVGYIVASKSTISSLALIKQGMDLCSSSLSQKIVVQLLKRNGFYQNNLDFIRKYYSKQSVFMKESIYRHFRNIATWQNPQGGLFIWMKIPGLNCKNLFKKAVSNGVAFMPGYPFYAGKKRFDDTLRLTFATSSARDIERGIKRLFDIIKKYKQ